MSALHPTLIGTGLGRLHVQQAGSGPPAFLWHSLFVDSQSWGGLVDAFANHRRVITIDGPCHGRSEGPDHDFTLDDCAIAAGEVLDRLGVTEPVDWVGNAWGGHVGIVFAASRPDRVRSLVTIGTPVQALSTRERITKITPLVQIYRVAGANGFITKALSDALLGSEAVAAQPDLAKVVMDSFRNADRAAMLRAMRSVMVNRPDIGNLLPSITAPALMLTARDDAMGWHLPDAQAAVDTMPNGRADAIAGAGHVSPLLLDAALLEKVIVEFWK